MCRGKAQVHDCAKHIETHGVNNVGKLLPLAGDVHHLELQLCRGEPDVGCLRPEVAELNFPGSWDLLSLLLKYSSGLLLLNLFLVTDGSQHLQERILVVEHLSHIHRDHQC